MSENRKSTARIVAIVCAIAVAVLGTLWLAAPVKRPLELTPKQKDAVAGVEKRLQLAKAYARSQGFLPDSLESVNSANREIKEYKEVEAKDSLLEWADYDIAETYRAARKPAEIAALQLLMDQVQQTPQAMNATAEMRDHLRAARQLTNEYASGWNDRIPQMVRGEVAYFEALCKDANAPAPTPLAKAVNVLSRAHKFDDDTTVPLRLRAHTKQAQRFFDAWATDSNASNAVVFKLLEAECDYITKQLDDPNFTVTVTADVSNRATDTTQFLALVDRFAALVEKGVKDFPRSEVVNEAAKKVRENIDYQTKHVVTGRKPIYELYFIIGAVENFELTLKKKQLESEYPKALN